MISKETAMSLPIGTELYHVKIKNADGTPERWRVNGKCKTWKTNNDWKLPIKHGLNSYAYLTQDNYDKLSEDFPVTCGKCGTEIDFSESVNPENKCFVFCATCRKEMKKHGSTQ
jgi:hypothetical protein